MRTPTASAHDATVGIGRAGGACRRAIRSFHHAGRRRSARGPPTGKAAPSGAHRQMRGTERVTSPAPFNGGVAGCPRRRGSRRRCAGSGSGERLPPYYSGSDDQIAESQNRMCLITLSQPSMADNVVLKSAIMKSPRSLCDVANSFPDYISVMLQRENAYISMFPTNRSLCVGIIVCQIARLRPSVRP